MSSETQDLAASALSKGSKSFHFASLFFPRDLQVGAAQVYYWCRHCDDLVDEAVINSENLPELVQTTLKIWDDGCEELDPPFLAMRQAVRTHRIPKEYLIDLLLGMKMDLSQTVYSEEKLLDLYCYRVAGTVGLMMCHIMGVFKIEALDQAVKLGKAMQLTNIARDIMEDSKLGRVYLPLTWLQEEGLTHETYLYPENRPALFRVTRRLLEVAESYYQEGMRGISELPFRAAFVIAIAANFYREIGREILRRGEPALETRVVVGRFRKAFLLLKSIIHFAKSVPGRIMDARKLITIDQVWRPVA